MRRAGLKALIMVVVQKHFRKYNRRLSIAEIAISIREYSYTLTYQIVNELIAEGRLRRTSHQWRFIALPEPN